MLTIISIISVVVGVVVCIYLCTRIRKETITLNSLKRENEACRTSLDIYEKSIELKQLEKDKLDKQIYETQVKHNSLSEQLRVLGELIPYKNSVTASKKLMTRLPHHILKFLKWNMIKRKKSTMTFVPN